MKVVILQPSYIPWRGYFDQIRRADVFVFYDDAQYDKHGWRNRNQIKTPQGKKWLTIPVHSRGATAGLPIHRVRIDWSKPWAEDHLKALTFSYGRAPHFGDHAAWLESAYQRRDEMLADFTTWMTMEIARHIGITDTRFLRSSELQGIEGKKTERLIQILQKVGGSHYISGPSARQYLDEERFEAAGIALEYVQYDYPHYPQLFPPFDGNVAIFDLMFMVGGEAMAYLKTQAPP